MDGRITLYFFILKVVYISTFIFRNLHMFTQLLQCEHISNNIFQIVHKTTFNCSNFASIKHSGYIIDNSYGLWAGWFVFPAEDSSLRYLKVPLSLIDTALVIWRKCLISMKVENFDFIDEKLRQECSLKCA